MVDLMLQCKKLERILELEKVSGKTTEEMLACFASDDEYPAFKCNDCPLRLKGICAPEHPGITCYHLWLDYLTGKDINEKTNIL